MVICPWVWQHWWFNVWSAAYLGDLCLIAGTFIWSGGCALSSASPWLCCFWAARYVRLFDFPSMYLVVLRDILFDSLESLWLDNARCELKISSWAWSSSVDLCRSSFCLDSGKVIVLIGLVSCFTDYFDLLWPRGRVAVTVSKGLGPDFLL